MNDIDKQILEAMEKLKYDGPTPFQILAKGKTDSEIDELIAAGKLKMSGFSGMPSIGQPITGPIQVYEDKFPYG